MGGLRVCIALPSRLVIWVIDTLKSFYKGKNKEHLYEETDGDNIYSIKLYSNGEGEYLRISR